MDLLSAIFGGDPQPNVVKERLKLPPLSPVARQVFPARPERWLKTLANMRFHAGTAAANLRSRGPERIAKTMDNSLLVSLSQQIAAYHAMDVIANNLANVSTPGFKRETAQFAEYVTQTQPAEGASDPGTVSFVQGAGITRDISQGNIENTGARYDFAINGKGFFTVQTPAGMRYTRDGHFTLDANGQIADSNGNLLQGDGGAITITPDEGDIEVGPDGTISGKTGQIGKLRLVDFADAHLMVKEGSNLYSTTQMPVTALNATIGQGALESSNVKPVLEISHMIEVMRAYQATASLSQSQQDLNRQAINKLGQMPN
jgi:flagellar basal-body rod protein FlgF